MTDRPERAAAERREWTHPYTPAEIEAIASGAVLARANNPAPYPWSYESRTLALCKIALDYAAALREDSGRGEDDDAR